MNKHLTKAFGAGVVASVLALGTVVAQEDGLFDWDDNGDGVDAEEWNDGFGAEGVFDDWDADADGTLTEDEFNTGVFSSYDEDDDDYLDDNELSAFEDDTGEDGVWDF